MTLHIMGDIDEVFFPWVDVVHEGCREAGLHNIPRSTSWDMWTEYPGATRDDWFNVVRNLTTAGMYGTTEPIPGSVAAWNRLRWHFGDEVKLHMVTARGTGKNWSHAERVRSSTATWLEEFGIAHDTLTFEKAKADAAPALGIYRFDYAIDDGVSHVEFLRMAGTDAHLMTAPHNEPVDHLPRVQTLDEFVDYVIGNHS